MSDNPTPQERRDALALVLTIGAAIYAVAGFTLAMGMPLLFNLHTDAGLILLGALAVILAATLTAMTLGLVDLYRNLTKGDDE